MTDAGRFVSVRENGEWGSFFVRSGVSEREGRDPQYWCELTCNTSFGCVGYFWGHMGRPAPEFLAKIDKHYVLDKLWGMKSEVFDSVKALKEARDLVLKERRAGDLTRYEARDRWDELEDESWDGEADFISFVHRCDWLYQHLSEGGGPLGQAPNPQAEGFWSTLWPDFIRQLSAQHSDPSGEQSIARRVAALADEMDHVAAADIANEPGSPGMRDALNEYADKIRAISQQNETPMEVASIRTARGEILSEAYKHVGTPRRVLLNAVDRIDASLAHQPADHSMVVVPREPTPDMLAAFDKIADWLKGDEGTRYAVAAAMDRASGEPYWKAMVAAARSTRVHATVNETTDIEVPHQECYSNDDGDSWRDCPDDADFVNGLQVGEKYELTVSHYSIRRTYVVTKAPDEASDDYEVAPTASQQESDRGD